MFPGMPALGIRFNVDEISQSDYGVECWKVLWKAVRSEKLCGAHLFEGDTMGTLNGAENVYVVAVQTNDEAMLQHLHNAIQESRDYAEVAPQQMFLYAAGVIAEPLTEAGTVDASGDLSGKSWNSGAALNFVRKTRPQPSRESDASAPAAREHGVPSPKLPTAKKWWVFWR